ncbi:MAG: VOC family protein [Lautropia sp.]
MFKSVHHLNYVVSNLDDMILFLEENFGMTPDHVVRYDHLYYRDAIYDVGDTHIQFTETWNPETACGRFLTKNGGPGLFHAAWAVDDLPNVARRLAERGHNMGKNHGVTRSPRGYVACNVDIQRSHGILFQLAEGKRQAEDAVGDKKP